LCDRKPDPENALRLQQENHHSSKIQEASLGMDSETANHETSIKES
jgi:hypothetical protein